VNLDPEKLIVLFVIAMLVLGPQRLPEAARTMGRWMAELRKYTSGFQSEFNNLLAEPREHTSALRDEFRSAMAEPKAALEAGAREAQSAVNSATAASAVTPAGEANADVAAPSLSPPEPSPVLPHEPVSAPLNAVPDDPSLN
jgi:sec-independent protein translocase protein TatB